MFQEGKNWNIPIFGLKGRNKYLPKDLCFRKVRFATFQYLYLKEGRNIYLKTYVPGR